MDVCVGGRELAEIQFLATLTKLQVLKNESLNLQELSVFTFVLRSQHINKHMNRCLTLTNPAACCGLKDVLLLVGKGNLI